MRYCWILILLLIAACESTGSKPVDDGVDPNADSDALEAQAYEVTGDVRVFYYVKDTLVPGSSGRDVRQEEQRSILLNKGHTFWRGVPDHELPKEYRYLHNSDMYDLLKIFKELGFFAKGSSVNIFADEPVARADNERITTRMIAVETIMDGKVNTSYFARRVNEHEVDKERAKLFNDCQAVLMQAIAGALPRGDAGYGEGDTSDIHKERR